MWKMLQILGAFALMVACGLACGYFALFTAFTFLMNLGSRLHGINDYYFYTGYPAGWIFVFGSGVTRCLAPIVIL